MSAGGRWRVFGGASGYHSRRRGGRPAASAAWQRAARELSPSARVVHAVEIRHPDLVAPLRAVNDVRDLELEGERYLAVPFALRLADDSEEQPPRAELRLDNVGRIVTAPIAATSGGEGAAVTVSEVLVADGAASVEWTQTIGVGGVTMDDRSVVLRLGFERLIGRPAVAVRHDPGTSPGLF